MVARAFQLYLLLTAVFAAVVDFEEAGAKADDSAEEVETWHSA